VSSEKESKTNEDGRSPKTNQEASSRTRKKEISLIRIIVRSYREMNLEEWGNQNPTAGGR